MKAILLLLAILAITATADPTPIREYVKGFFQGIRETRGIEDLDKCMDPSEHILTKIRAALELMKQLKIEPILQGLSMLFEALYEMEEMLRPCLDKHTQFKKLMDAIDAMDINMVLAKLMENPLKYLASIIEVIRYMELAKFELGGKSLGIIMYDLFLATMILAP